jgi:hypothetical protein
MDILLSLFPTLFPDFGSKGILAFAMVTGFLAITKSLHGRPCSGMKTCQDPLAGSPRADIN